MVVHCDPHYDGLWRYVPGYRWRADHRCFHDVDGSGAVWHFDEYCRQNADGDVVRRIPRRPRELNGGIRDPDLLARACDWCELGAGVSDGAGRPLAGSREWVGVVQALAGWGESCGLPMPAHRSWPISACWVD